MEPLETTGDEKPRPRGGRPWSFDREAAVETAMTLFWRHGYEGVSMGRLTEAVGVAAPSLYAAFGSKAGLYREALDRYEAGVGRLDVEAAMSATTLPAAIRAILTAAAGMAVREGLEQGCMVSVGSIACGPRHDDLVRDLAARRERSRMQIAEVLARFGEEARILRLSRTLVAVMQGLSVQARDGATLEELLEIVDEIVEGVAARS